jgi:hypothetical protein
MAHDELSTSHDVPLGDGDCLTVIDVRPGVGEITGTAREHRSAEPVDPAVSFLADTSPNSQPEPGGGNGGGSDVSSLCPQCGRPQRCPRHTSRRPTGLTNHRTGRRTASPRLRESGTIATAGGLGTWLM